MATYNGARYLEEQLDSIARQTHHPVELVVGDDGSTDDTLEILATFARSSPFPLRVHRNTERLDFADNFLQAASRCRAALVAFCDQDDVWHETKLERCVSEFQAPDCRLVVHASEIVDAALRPVGGQIPSRRTMRRLRSGRIVPWVEAPGLSMVVSAEILRFDVGTRPPGPRSEGPMPHDSWVALIAGALGRIVPVEEPLAMYRQHHRNVAGVPIPGLPGRKGPSRPDSNAYLRLARLAADYATMFGGLAREHLEFSPRFEHAARFYARLAESLRVRASIYDLTTSRWARLRSWADLALGGSYVGKGEWPLGLPALVKDFAVSLTAPRPSWG